MLSGQDRSWQALARAVDVAIARGALEEKARGWGKVVLLEAMAGILGVGTTKLRNQYYRGDPRLELQLLDYAMTSINGAVDALRSLEFRRFSPIVWKRPLDQLAASRESLMRTLALLRMAERLMRAEFDPPVELRREIGTVAAEVMACALTFFDGESRWRLLAEGDLIFRAAMGPLTLEGEFAPEDAALFARFWENRATRCGLEWSNIYDDPSRPPTIGMDVVDLALDELERATTWMKQHWVPAEVEESERVRQFAADKAKWLAKAGHFEDARKQIEQLGDFPGAQDDRLLIRALAEIAANSLDAALRTSSELAERLGETRGSIAPITSAIMVHNIELMRGKRPALAPEVAQFLRESPVAGSEHVNLPRYRKRLQDLGYTEVES
jgi:hypothetical protein